jgi:molybdenum cofactor synthesis domain-containing protein
VDLSGPAVAKALERRNFQVVLRSVVADERAAIQEKLMELCRSAGLVVTTGGTGIAPRDVTPEATSAVCERLVEGIAEQMRLAGMRKTPFAALSRAVCGVRGTSLILNLPGSPGGAVESLEAVVDLLPHVLELIAGKTAH